MSRVRAPATPAVRVLRAAGVAFTDHPYAYEEHGGTAVPARELGIEPRAVAGLLQPRIGRVGIPG